MVHSESLNFTVLREEVAQPYIGLERYRNQDYKMIILFIRYFTYSSIALSQDMIGFTIPCEHI